MLLSDEETAKWLSKEFVLSWENVREPAKVTIDFGAGRLLSRTLAGNTAFYLATPDGTVVDVFPGVYTPEDFKKVVMQGYELYRQVAADPGDDHVRLIRESHENAFFRAAEFEMARTTGSKMYVESPLLDAMVAAGPKPPKPPRARTTMSKGAVESPLLNALEIRRIANTEKSRETLDFEGFASRLVDISKTPMRSAEARESLGLDPALAEEEQMMEIVRLDSRTNVRSVRPAVHLMFRDAVTRAMRPQDLTRTVYGTLLHIDVDDPYLGLADNLIPGTGG